MIDFEQLARNMKGDVMTDSLHQMIYATDASAYREIPLAVVYPRDASDVKECIKFARKNGITLIDSPCRGNFFSGAGGREWGGR